MSDGKKNRAPQRGLMGGRGPGSHSGAPAEKARDFRGTVKKLFEYLGGYKLAVVLVVIFAGCSSAFSILGPKILGNATTELFNGVMASAAGTGAGIDFGKIGGILAGLLGLYVLSFLFSLAEGYIMTGVANRVSYRLRRDIDDKIHALPFAYYDRTPNGEVLSRLTNDVDAINQGLNNSLTEIVTSVATVTGILAMMLSISWRMTLIAAVTLPLSMGVILAIAAKSQKYFVRQQELLGRINGKIEENYGCHNIVKAFGGEARAVKELGEDNAQLFSAAWRANFLSGLMMPVTAVIGNLGYVAVCVAGGYLAARGAVTVGNIQAFIQYMRNLTMPVSHVAQISNMIQQTVASAERVFELLAEAEEQADEEGAVCVCRSGEAPDENRAEVTGSVSFKNVSFGYFRDKPVIKGFSAEVRPGQKIAIVGPTGAGKTTLVKLLMRFYDVQGGGIELDGRDIRGFLKDELRSVFGMVLQDTWLFSGTIADNIRYGKPDADDKELREAAAMACADRFISALPGGYDMELNEEADNVSQGQKQLITIARAVLANPRILILDEATSSVDTRTELLIQRAMDNLMKGRTSFIIAHRLSTVRNADMILVIDGGDIIEKGSHDELLSRGGFYASLYNSQFQSAT